MRQTQLTDRASSVTTKTAFLLVVACFPPAAALGIDSQPELTIFETSAPLTAHNKIDEVVFARWKELGMKPANPHDHGIERDPVEHTASLTV